MDIVPSTMKGMEYQLSSNVQDRLEVGRTRCHFLCLILTVNRFILP
jgi:hypothetical protein